MRTKNEILKTERYLALTIGGTLIGVILTAILAILCMNTLEPQAITEYIVVEAEEITEPVKSYVETEVKKPVSEAEVNAGIASIIKGEANEELLEAINEKIEENANKLDYLEGYEEPQYIRCTGYCDYGYTKSGEYVRHGIVAGKKEWLGKTCYIYQVADDGSCGELIGIYEFLDTGYGIKGSLINGTSIDVWHPSEDAVWDWMGTYGDYVYIQIVNAEG